MVRMVAVRNGIVVLALAMAFGSAAVFGQSTGSVRGQITRPDATPLSGVLISIESVPKLTTLSDDQGAFVLKAVPPGVHDVRFELGSEVHREESVEVEAGVASEVSPVVDWQPGFAEALTVYAASKQRERIVDAPAAVNTVTPEEINRTASTGQAPKLLESATGVEITQSGLYDFKLNARGLNTSVNRRIAVLIDGRDPSFPFLGAQEWAAVSFPLDDLAGAELVRGPRSALYGANAFNGILDLTTRAPRLSQGGLVRLTGGELSTGRLDFRFAGQATDSVHYKILGLYTESDDFSVSRNETVEYSQPCTPLQSVDCLSLEAVPLALDRDRIQHLSARLDKDFRSGDGLVVEGGVGNIEGYVYAAPGSRFQVLEADRPWARAFYHAKNWNVLGSYTGRQVEAVTLASGTPSFVDSSRAGIEGQAHWGLAGGRGRMVIGGSAYKEEVDTADPSGMQTLIPNVEDDSLLALFGQLDYALADAWKLVVALRFDDSTFYDVQVSPKVSLVWSANPTNTLRLSYNEGFLRPNYPEYFVRVPLAPPLDLSPFEAFCTPAGVSCGFDTPTPLLAVGNEDLVVETIRSLEVGYSLLFASRGLLTISAYMSEIEEFVQQFIPQLGTRLGRANPNFGPYAPPAELPAPLATALVATLEGALGPLYPFLSTENGMPLFALRTAINFGQVESRGAEVSLDYQLAPNWALATNYSWLDLRVKDELPEAPLESNGPEHKFNAGVTYSGERLGASLFYRWVDSFLWAEGVLIGPVPSYDVVNLAATYELTDNWQLGVNVSNALDDEHYELFSGDLLGRRALAHIRYSW